MKSDRLDVVVENWDGCDSCNAMRGKRKVYWRGDPDSPLAIIGEAPGAEENEDGRPFVGPSGRKLDEALRLAEIEPSEVFITNVVACQPPGNRAPTIDEIRDCSGRLQETLKIVRPKALLLLGATAARLVGVRHVEGNRGDIHIAEVLCYDGKIRAWPAIVTYHPAFVLRMGEAKNAHLIHDISKAWKLALARADKTD